MHICLYCTVVSNHIGGRGCGEAVSIWVLPYTMGALLQCTVGCAVPKPVLRSVANRSHLGTTQTVVASRLVKKPGDYHG